MSVVLFQVVDWQNSRLKNLEKYLFGTKGLLHQPKCYFCQILNFLLWISVVPPGMVECSPLTATYKPFEDVFPGQVAAPTHLT